MYSSQLINNDMKDLSQSDSRGNLTLTAFLLPVAALVAILGGLLISDGPVLANQSAEATRITADLNEDYFINETDRLAQAGDLLESRSEMEAETESETEASADNDEEAVGENSETAPGECSTAYLDADLRIDFNNDREDVLKLQSFLKTFENYDYVSLNGTFDEATLRAVKAFQSRYAEDILEPWGYQADEATGYVYITTKQKINEIYCDEQFLLSRSQQSEIRSYRQKLNNWRAQGASFETPNYLAVYYGTGTTYEPADPAGEDSSETNSDTDTDSEGVAVTEDATTSASTTATSSDDESRGFFDWLFGNDVDEGEMSTTSTTTDEDVAKDDEVDDGDSDVVVREEPSEDELASTSGTSTATSGLDQLAAGVYTGVNSVINFLLSPTFLLIVLVVLILLLIATLIETDGEETETDDTDETTVWEGETDEADETTDAGDETTDGDDSEDVDSGEEEGSQ